MTPLITALFSQGLSMLGNAVLAKGQDVIEKKLGVSLDPDKTPPAELRKLEIAHQEFLLEISVQKQKMEIEAEQAAQSAVTERWKADMISDSYLSKNIRPLVLIYLLVTYSVLATASAFNLSVTQAYVELLAQMLMLVMGAYFAGRTVEKIVDMKERGK